LKEALIGDIGGTKSRLALYSFKDSSFKNLKVFYNKDFSSIEAVLTHYLKEQTQILPETLFLALAGPVLKGKARLTNLGWVVSERSLKKRFPFKRVILVNDLYALAGCVFHLKEEELLLIKEGKREKGAPRAFLAPGTGLGVSFLLSERPLEVLASEGGHTPFAPQRDEELRFIEFLKRFGLAPTYEEALSGKGLTNWYTFFTGLKKPPEEIIQDFHRGEEEAERVVMAFFEILGRKCYEIAVFMQPSGGLYLAGGVIENLKEAFERKDYREAFLENLYFSERLKGLIERIPVFLILHPFPVLLGAQTILRNLLR